jgi:hypothetical protein
LHMTFSSCENFNSKRGMKKPVSGFKTIIQRNTSQTLKMIPGYFFLSAAF